MTTYKKLIVSGCSFTAGDCWAYWLAKKYDLELINLSCPGAGNKHISDSLILYLEGNRNKININEVLIGAMWSGIARHHWTISLDNPRYKKYLRHQYDEDIFLTFPHEILDDNNLTKDMVVHDPELAMLELAYYRGISARQLDGLLSMIQLNSYLISNRSTFFQTHFFDPNGGENQGGYMVGTRYTEACDKFGIDRPSTGMLNFAPGDFLGNWAANQNLIWSVNDRHPTVHGHKLWAETVLIPQLIQQKLLTTG